LLEFQRFGSVIGLKREFEERYIILHKHTFPGVLKRIHDSNIRNYSIFLRDGILFSYYEYTGRNYEEDKQKIGEDKTTQEWWKLTGPMQVPLGTRKEGEWWAEMKELYFFSSEEKSDIHVERFACLAEENQARVSDSIFAQSVPSTLPINKISLFQNEGHIFLYCEFFDTDISSAFEKIAERIDHLFPLKFFEGRSKRWKNMLEVFHTG
jgi:L-rhamnose mutarotase